MTVLFIALTLDILLGEAPDRLHPVCFMGRWAVCCETFFRARCGGTLLSGVGAALAVVLPFAGVGAGLVWLVPTGWAQVVAGGVLYVCVAPRSLAEHAQAVARALDAADLGVSQGVGQGGSLGVSHGANSVAHDEHALDAARQAVSRMVGRETARLDAHGVARAAVESVGENLVDGVLASLFWAAAGLGLGQVCGLDTTGTAALAAGLAVTHRGFNTLDAMWGKRTERYARFGTCAARVDDALAFVPARLSLLLIAVAALTLRGHLQTACDAVRVGFRDRYALSSPNSAWSEAAFAGALRLRLCGPLVYAGVIREAPWIGDATPYATADATPAHIREAVTLMWRTTMVCALGLGLGLS